MPKTISRPRRPFRPEPAPNRKRWTRQQYYVMRNCGILIGHYELIDGEVISKMGQNASHALVVRLLMIWLVAVFGAEFVGIQSPIDVAEADNPINEPEPDASVTSRPAVAYAAHIPGPADLLLVVEVSDTTLRFDLRTKAALYARAGISEYWVVDIVGRRIVVHRAPTPQGYQQITAYDASESLSPLARPEAAIAVSELLPPVEA